MGRFTKAIAEAVRMFAKTYNGKHIITVTIDPKELANCVFEKPSQCEVRLVNIQHYPAKVLMRGIADKYDNVDMALSKMKFRAWTEHLPAQNKTMV